MSTFFETDLFPIADPADVDANLIADCGSDTDYTAYFARQFDGDFLTGNALHLVWYADAGRAGIIYVGSGSSGATVWTDAASPEDALRRYLEDDLQP